MRARAVLWAGFPEHDLDIGWRREAARVVVEALPLAEQIVYNQPRTGLE